MSDLLTVTVRGELEGRAVSCGFSYHKSTGPLDANRAGLMAVAFAGHLQTAWLNMLSHDYALQSYDCRDPQRAVAWPNYTPREQIQGGIAQQSMPSSQALIVRLGVDAETARSNGRLYICGVPETVVVNQRLDEGYRNTIVQNFADLILDDLVLTDGSTWQLVVLKRDRVNHPPNTPDWNPVVQATPLSKLITQRRRLTELRGTTAT